MELLKRLRKQYRDLARKVAEDKSLTEAEQISYDRLYADPAFKELVARTKATL